MTAPTKTRTLSTAEQRRGELVEAAVPVFAAHGYHAASTVEIAKAAGISQAYVFRLFPSKAELFAAVTDEASRRMQRTFTDAAARARAEGLEPLAVMGEAYDKLLERDRDVLLVQLHSQVAASAEPLVRDAVRRCFRNLYDLVARESGASPEELRDWFAHGMLCNVMAAIDAETLQEEWAQALNHHEPH